MNKAIVSIIGFFAILVFSNSVYAAAATWAQTGGAGTTVTIGATGSQLTFNPSPGVIVEGASDITVYCILTGNSKAGADAIVYNVSSASGAVAQKAIDLSTATTFGETIKTDGTLVTGFTTK